MMFDYSDKTKALIERVSAFMDEHVYPNEDRYEQEVAEGDRWKVLPVIEELKPLARKAGLWNLFLNICDHDVGEWKGPGLTNLEYAPLAEIMGRVGWSSEVFNCSAPDTGNMEVLRTYGSEEQKQKWLKPLMAGEMRSAFLMTEPAVASSDATNIETSIVRQGDEYVVNGRKWWSSGVGDPRCQIAIVMGKTDPTAPRHSQQSQILVPMDAPGIVKLRPLKVFGYDDAPHGHFEVILDNVRVPVGNMILGEGKGFRDRTGAAWSGPYPPLHAQHRCRRTRAGKNGQAAEIPRGLWQADFGTQPVARTHCRFAHCHRTGSAAHAQGRLYDGHRRQQGCRQRNRHDQGGRAEHELPDP